MFVPPRQLMLCARAVAIWLVLAGPGRGLVMSGDRSDVANNSAQQYNNNVCKSSVQSTTFNLQQQQIAPPATSSYLVCTLIRSPLTLQGSSSSVWKMEYEGILGSLK